MHGLAAFYALCVAIGLVMATVLYEPAFTVGPVAAALWATAVGYQALLWTLVAVAAVAVPLAFRAEG